MVIAEAAYAAPSAPEVECGAPSGWEVKPLGAMIALQRGHDLTARQRRQGDIPVMGSAGQNGFHDTALVNGPGVVLGRSGASFGQAHYCETDFWPHNTALYVTDFRGNNPLFIYYFLKSIDFSRHNSGGAQQSLNRNFIYPIIVAIPSPHEQEVIASAFQDVDSSINSLERLIEKKRAIKQGMMQELLTGKRRLPGFSGEWRKDTLSALVDIRSGGTPSTSRPEFWGGGIPWCTPTDITALERKKYLRDTARTISTAGLSASSAEMIPPQSVIMTSRATIGECAINTKAVTTNQGFKNLIPLDRTDVEFLYYYMSIQKERLIALCGGSTFLEIGKGQLSSFEVEVPATKEEQKAIATSLAAIDSELVALEQKLTKASQIKQGMMQELLTGKVRLV